MSEIKAMSMKVMPCGFRAAGQPKTTAACGASATHVIIIQLSDKGLRSYWTCANHYGAILEDIREVYELRPRRDSHG